MEEGLRRNRGTPPMCGIPKMLRVVSKVGPNRGREFFACPKPIGAQCQGELKCCDEPTAPTLVTWEAKSEEKSYQIGRDFLTCPKPYIPTCSSSFEGCFNSLINHSIEIIDQKKTYTWFLAAPVAPGLP